jgi:hypothetical protein
MLTGQCFCGQIKYQASSEPYNKTICHCTMCRGTTGTPCVAWFSVPLDSFRFTSGTPTSFRSSGHGVRSFCPTCGTQLTFADSRYPDEIDITTCSLAQPEAVPPDSHTYTASAMPWLSLDDGLPCYLGSRESASASQTDQLENPPLIPT